MTIQEAQTIQAWMSGTFQQSELQLKPLAGVNQYVIYVKSLDFYVWSRQDWDDLQSGKKRPRKVRVV